MGLGELMVFRQIGNVRYLTLNMFDSLGVINAIITRTGGFSSTPYASLNVGSTVGDNPELVERNKDQAFTALNVSPRSIYDVWQVHGADVVCTDRPRPDKEPHKKADAILTDQPGVNLFMRFADCVPILLFDPIRRVIGLAHAGWKGTVLRTAAYAVIRMREVYGSLPADIMAVIGPSIGQHHYEVGAVVESEVRRAFGAESSKVLRSSNGKNESGFQFDLWRANQLVLEQVGVQQIEITGLCTACHLSDWYSHRAEGGNTGRFGALIALRDE